MTRSDDPVKDWSLYCSEQEEELKRRPVCDCCEEHIISNIAYRIHEDVVCPDCLQDKAIEIIERDGEFIADSIYRYNAEVIDLDDFDASDVFDDCRFVIEVS